MKHRFVSLLALLTIALIVGLAFATHVAQMALAAPPPALQFVLHYDWWSTGSYLADASSYRTVSGDFNGDGRDDIAMLHRTSSTMARFYVILGAGDHFQTHTIWLILNLVDANSMTGRVVAGDFNNDGYDDVAAFVDTSVNTDTYTYVFLSNGSSFTLETWWGPAADYWNKITGRVVAGDFDGDGWKDDIATLYDDGSPSHRADVFISDGSSFTHQSGWWQGVGFSPSLTTNRTVAGDVDADGDDDVVVVYKFADTVTRVHVLRSSGSAFSFEAMWWEGINISADQTSGRVVAGDFDGDDDDDVALLRDRGQLGSRADVLLSTRDTFSDQSSLNGWWSNPSYVVDDVTGRVVAGDWNGNGVDDVGMIYRVSSSVTRADVLEATAPPPEPPTTRQVDGNDPACSDTVGVPFCTIQAAVNAASDGDVIQVTGGIYFEEVRMPKYDFSGFNQSLTIQGAGQANTFVDGSAGERAFNIIEGGKVTLSELTIRNGNANPSGGGIFIYSAVLTVTNSTIISNTTASSGGGIYNQSGSLTINDSTLSDNAAGLDGGAIFNEGGTVNLYGSTLSHNSADRDGGAIFNDSGTVTFNGIVIDSNQSADDGGGIFNDAGVVNLNGSFVRSNDSTDGGGGIFNLNGSLSIDNSTLRNNVGEGSGGGGIFNLGSGPIAISNSVVSDNSGDFQGGGIFNLDGVGTVSGSTFSNNTAGRNGGGLFNGNGNLTISNSTFSNNTSDIYGGGVFNLDASLTFSNSTFSSNSAVVASGGALYASGNGTLKINNSTFSGNSSGDFGGGIYAAAGITLTLANNIVVNSTAGGDCSGPGTWNTAGSPNLDSDGTCPGFSLTGNPLLGSLADNGGTTPTHALLAGSPAIDAGNNAACPPTDQRGLSRPEDGDGDGTATCDLGAFEFRWWTSYLPIVVKH